MSTERIARLLACLPDSGLPPDLQVWLVEVFKYRRSAAFDLADRDALIRLVIDLAPGTSRTAKIAYFIDALEGRTLHQSVTAQGMLAKLNQSGIYIPRSVKQLRRIIAGRRQDGWKGTELCPPASTGQDEKNLEDLGYG